MIFVTVYKDLIEKYPTWNELETYLTSVHGGLLHISDKNDKLCIIRSKKGTNMNLPHVKWFRSTVWDMELNRPVSVAPPKSSKYFPYESVQQTIDAGIFCQEFYDGFMINCFKRDDNELFVTSRSKLNATGNFYSSKSFCELFKEAYTGDKLDAPLQHELSVSYSFVVQHQEHRVVTPIHENRALLLQKATFFNDASFFLEDRIETFQGMSNIPTIAMDTTMTVNEWLNLYFLDKSWEFQGVVLKDLNGNRWKFRHEPYMVVKELRGNSSSDIERFSQLYLKNLIKPYLEYYPLESFTFICNNIFMNMLHQLVYNHYVQVFIKRTVKMNEVEQIYRRNLYHLHTYYIHYLRPQKRKITYNEVAYYFSKMSWQSIAFLLRHMQDSYFEEIGEAVNQ